jgi:RecD/TraA family predicted helicase
MLSPKLKCIMLVSPTAKAAKVLSKSTGREATTIHRALKWKRGGFEYNLNNKLHCDLMVIDESSMIDIYLFRSLIQAIPDGCRILLIGDTAQLESISVGNVLHDIINSNIYTVVALTQVFRQALESGILYAATQVREGNKFYLDNNPDEGLEMGSKKDCRVWFGRKETSLNRVVAFYSQCIKLWDIEDILVISPMKKGNSGINILNKTLQDVSNPLCASKLEVKLDSVVFRVGDKVRHTRNDYNAIWLDANFEPINESKTGVFNGDFGMITAIESNIIYVDYGDKIIQYPKPYKYLDLAYAITCHSSQGSQSKIVIGVVDISHYMNLKRNLVYTLMTRAEERLFMVIEKKAMGIAIYNNTIPKKRTFLESIIREINER